MPLSPAGGGGKIIRKNALSTSPKREVSGQSLHRTLTAAVSDKINVQLYSLSCEIVLESFNHIHQAGCSVVNVNSQ